MNLRRLVLATLCTSLAGCAQAPRAPGADESREMQRAVAESAARAAVAKPGARVCRLMEFGIGERDWIRGVVLGPTEAGVRVRIEDPGRYPHTLNRIIVMGGVVLEDSPINWTPCD